MAKYMRLHLYEGGRLWFIQKSYWTVYILKYKNIPKKGKVHLNKIHSEKPRLQASPRNQMIKALRTQGNKTSEKNTTASRKERKDMPE